MDPKHHKIDFHLQIKGKAKIVDVFYNDDKRKGNIFCKAHMIISYPFKSYIQLYDDMPFSVPELPFLVFIRYFTKMHHSVA